METCKATHPTTNEPCGLLEGHLVSHQTRDPWDKAKDVRWDDPAPQDKAPGPDPALVQALAALPVGDLQQTLVAALQARSDAEYRGRSGTDAWLVGTEADLDARFEVVVQEPWDV